MDLRNTLRKTIQLVTKKLLCKGEKGRKPSEGSVCTVVVNSRCGDLHQVSEIFKTTNLTFTVGDSYELIGKVIEYCVTLMNVGEESVFNFICEQITHSVYIKLDLCFFKPYSSQMSEREKISLANMYKTKGVELFKAEKILPAFYKFTDALKIILTLKCWFPVIESEIHLIEEVSLDEAKLLRINVLNNLASCQLHFKNFCHCISLCNKSLILEDNVKGYYRRALSYIQLKDFEKAQNDLRSLLKMEPENKVALSKLLLVRSLDKDNQDSYKATVKKMFS